MRRAAALIAALLLSLLWLRPALAQPELQKERDVLKFCRSHRRGVRRDPHARRACARAARLIPSLVRNQIVYTARRYLGVPYVWGGTSPRGFDCSGLVQYVYRRALGIRLGRTTFAQLGEGMRVRRLLPGDVVFTRGGEHEGLYIGGGAVIHAPHTGDHVRITSLGYFLSDGYAGARRFA